MKQIFFLVILFAAIGFAQRTEISFRDSVSNEGADSSSTYDFGADYTTGYVQVYNPTATADTVKLKYYSLDVPGWSATTIGFRNLFSGSIEADNEKVIIGALTSTTYEANIKRPGRIMVISKALTDSTKYYVRFRGVN